jgi:hypothetical protein
MRTGVPSNRSDGATKACGAVIARSLLSLVTRPGGHPDVDDFRIRVVLEPLALPWPVTFYFTEAVHEDGATVFICEGSEHGAAVGPGQEALDAEQSIRAAEHWRDYRDAYEQMAAYLCWPTPENRQALPRSMPVGSFGGDVAAAPTGRRLAHRQSPGPPSRARPRAVRPHLGYLSPGEARASMTSAVAGDSVMPSGSFRRSSRAVFAHGCVAAARSRARAASTWGS